MFAWQRGRQGCERSASAANVASDPADDTPLSLSAYAQAFVLRAQVDGENVCRRAQSIECNTITLPTHRAGRCVPAIGNGWLDLFACARRLLGWVTFFDGCTAFTPLAPVKSGSPVDTE